jgi:hypothetical protein
VTLDSLTVPLSKCRIFLFSHCPHSIGPLLEQVFVMALRKEEEGRSVYYLKIVVSTHMNCPKFAKKIPTLVFDYFVWLIILCWSCYLSVRSGNLTENLFRQQEGSHQLAQWWGGGAVSSHGLRSYLAFN